MAELAETFRLLGEPNRLRLVLACMGGQRSVSDLCDELAMPQTLASHHLRLLRTARILRSRRDGRHIHYQLDDEHVRDVVGGMVAHLTEPHEHASAGDNDNGDG